MPKICSVDGCDRLVGPHGAKGLCPFHYVRLKKHGDPLWTPPPKVEYPIKRKCIQCGETKLFYHNSVICQACIWWYKHHNGEKRTGAIRVRDNFASEHLDEYSIYRDMHCRCKNKNNKKYKDYGGRGVKVCSRWSGPYGFHHFYEDMGPRPEGRYASGLPKYSLDRIDVNGDYCPENCRWATAHTQVANRRIERMYSNQVGVTYNKAIGWWTASLQIDKEKHTKNAHTEAEAIRMRKELEDKYLH